MEETGRRAYAQPGCMIFSFELFLLCLPSEAAPFGLKFVLMPWPLSSYSSGALGSFLSDTSKVCMESTDSPASCGIAKL